MADDAQEKLRAATRYLGRTKTPEQIADLADQAFAAVAAGTTVVELTFEGGKTTSVVTFDSHILLNACEDLLAAADPNAVKTRVIHQDFSAQYVQT